MMRRGERPHEDCACDFDKSRRSDPMTGLHACVLIREDCSAPGLMEGYQSTGG